MKKHWRTITVVLVGCATVWLFKCGAASALILNDGGVHNIDDDLWGEWVYIYDNVNPPHNYTTVNLLDGGHLNSLIACDNSIATMSQGSHVGSIELGENATFINYGGVGDGLLDAKGTVKFYGGDIDSAIIYGNANFLGGGIYNLSGPGSISIYDSFYSHNFWPDGEVKVFGGEISALRVLGGTLDIFGGDISGDDLPFLNSGAVTLYGNHFNLPYGTYTPSDNLEYVSGILRDGSPIEWGSGSAFMSGDATLTLKHVPEPSTFMLIGTALVGLIVPRINRKFKK